MFAIWWRKWHFAAGERSLLSFVCAWQMWHGDFNAPIITHWLVVTFEVSRTHLAEC